MVLESAVIEVGVGDDSNKQASRDKKETFIDSKLACFCIQTDLHWALRWNSPRPESVHSHTDCRWTATNLHIATLLTLSCVNTGSA